jgi:hypothetical protein
MKPTMIRQRRLFSAIITIAVLGGGIQARRSYLEAYRASANSKFITPELRRVGSESADALLADAMRTRDYRFLNTPATSSDVRGVILGLDDPLVQIEGAIDVGTGDVAEWGVDEDLQHQAYVTAEIYNTQLHRYLMSRGTVDPKVARVQRQVERQIEEYETSDPQKALAVAIRTGKYEVLNVVTPGFGPAGVIYYPGLNDDEVAQLDQCARATFKVVGVSKDVTSPTQYARFLRTVAGYIEKRNKLFADFLLRHGGCPPQTKQ